MRRARKSRLGARELTALAGDGVHGSDGEEKGLEFFPFGLKAGTDAQHVFRRLQLAQFVNSVLDDLHDLGLVHPLLLHRPVRAPPSKGHFDQSRALLRIEAKGDREMSTLESEPLVAKVTKESLEDIAAREAVRHNERLGKRVVAFFILLAVAGVLLPSGAWWLLVPAALGFALYFHAQLNKLEDLRGRAARASGRPRRPSGYSDTFVRAH